MRYPVRVDVGPVRLGQVLRCDAPGVIEVEALGENHRWQPDPNGRLRVRRIVPTAGETGSPVSHDHSLCT